MENEVHQDTPLSSDPQKYSALFEPRENLASPHLHSGSYEFWDAIKAQKQADKELNLGFTDLYKREADKYHLSKLFGNASAFPEVPGYKVEYQLFSDSVDELGIDKDDDSQEFLVKATSPQDFEFRKQDIRDTIEKNRILGNYGFKGGLAAVVADMTDPIELGSILATSIATFGAGSIPAVARMGHKVYKSSLAVGALTGLEGAAYEQVRNAYTSAVTDEDVAWNAAIGFGLGSGSHKLFKLIEKSRKNTIFTRRMTANVPLTPEEKIIFKDQLENFPEYGDVAPNPNKPADGELSGMDTLAREEVDFSPKKREGETVDGEWVWTETEEAFAARTGREADDYEHMAGGSWLSFGLRKFMSSTYAVKNSANSVLNKLGDRLGGNFAGTYKLDADGNKVFVSTPFSASEFQTLIQARHRKERAEAFHKEFPKWKEANPRGTEEDFRIAVGRLVDDPVGVTGSPLDNMVKVLRRQLKDIKDQGIAYKVKGYKLLQGSEGLYYSRLFDNGKIREFHAADPEGFKKEFSDMVEQALIRERNKAKPDKPMETDFVNKLAKGYSRAVINRASKIDGTSLQLGQVDEVFEEVISELEQVLLKKGKDGKLYVDKEMLDEALNILFGTAKRTAEGKGHTRARVRLDEHTPLGESGLEFRDFLIKDYDHVMGHYDFHMGAQIGLARNGIDIEGGKSFESILEAAKKENLNTGKMSIKEIESVLRDSRYMYDSLQGNFHIKAAPTMTSSTHELLRRIRAWTFFRSMGLSGMAAMMELPIIFAEQSLPIIFKHLPRIPKLIASVRYGNVDDIASRELNALVGSDASVLSGKVTSRFDTVGDEFRVGERTKLDDVLDNARQITAVASGLTPVTDGLRRIATMFYGETWADAARKFKRAGSTSSSITPYNQIKLRQLGVSNRGMKNIYDQINKHVDFDAKGNIKTWNFDKWDANSRELFQLSAHREATTLVQETDIGSVRHWSRSPIGKTLFQFQSFVLGSMEQQLYRYAGRAQGGEVGVLFKAMMGSVVMGTLIHVAKVHMKSAGMSPSDAEDYRERWLSDEGVVKGAVGLMGATGIYQTVAQRMFGGTDMLIQNPTLDYFSSVLDVGENAVDAVMGDGNLTEAQYRKALSLVTPYTLLPMTYLNNNMAKHLAD